MSATNVDLGNVEYIYLRNVDCNNGLGAASATSFTWNMPYINPKQAPYMFIQIVQAYLDIGGGADVALANHLRYASVTGSNNYSTNSAQLASLMQRDALGAHWINLSEAPMIQVPSNINQITFTCNQNIDGVIMDMDVDASLEIVLKIVRPKQGEITQNTLASYVRTMP